MKLWRIDVKEHIKLSKSEAKRIQKLKDLEIEDRQTIEIFVINSKSISINKKTKKVW
jgi:hypothetical protein